MVENAPAQLAWVECLLSVSAAIDILWYGITSWGGAGCMLHRAKNSLQCDRTRWWHVLLGKWARSTTQRARHESKSKSKGGQRTSASPRRWSKTAWGFVRAASRCPSQGGNFLCPRVRQPSNHILAPGMAEVYMNVTSCSSRVVAHVRALCFRTCVLCVPKSTPLTGICTCACESTSTSCRRRAVKVNSTRFASR